MNVRVATCPPSLGGAISVIQSSRLGLQFLLQRGDLVIERLNLLTLGIVLPLQVGEAALKVVGLGDGFLESDDGDLRRAGRIGGGGRGG